MTAEFVGLLVVYLVVLLAIAPFLGRYIRIAMENGQSRLTAWGRPLERGIYQMCIRDRWWGSGRPAAPPAP